MEQSQKIDQRIVLIGERLKELRKEKGYTSHENFAWDNGLGRVQYWRMEKGTNFTMKNLLRILDIHKISLEEFFKGL